VSFLWVLHLNLGEKERRREGEKERRREGEKERRRHRRKIV